MTILLDDMNKNIEMKEELLKNIQDKKDNIKDDMIFTTLRSNEKRSKSTSVDRFGSIPIPSKVNKSKFKRLIPDVDVDNIKNELSSMKTHHNQLKRQLKEFSDKYQQLYNTKNKEINTLKKTINKNNNDLSKNNLILDNQNELLKECKNINLDFKNALKKSTDIITNVNKLSKFTYNDKNNNKIFNQLRNEIELIISKKELFLQYKKEIENKEKVIKLKENQLKNKKKLEIEYHKIKNTIKEMNIK